MDINKIFVRYIDATTVFRNRTKRIYPYAEY